VTEAGTRPSGWTELFRGKLAITTLLVNLGVSLHAIDIFVITTVMPTVVAEIGGAAYYAWAVMLYVVGSIVGAAAFGPLRIALGGRVAYALGGVVFLFGTMVVALAPDMVALLIGRTIEGIGGGVAMAGSYAMIGTLFPPRLRPHILTTSNVTWTVATFVGPALGGIFAEIEWWRGAFWAMIPFELFFIACAWWLVPSDRPTGTRPSFPVLRIALLTLGILSIAMSAQVAAVGGKIALIAIAIAVVWDSVRRDHKAENRMFPSRPLSLSRPVGTAFWIQALVAISQTTLYIYPPLVLQVGYGLAPLYVGVANGLLSLGWSCGAGIVTPLKDGRERWAMFAGVALFFVALVPMAFYLAELPLWFILTDAFIIGWGIGMQNVHMVSKSISVAEKGEENITSSSLATVRSLGVAFGSALSGLVANLAGLDPNAGAESVLEAISWVYIWDLVPIAAAMLLMLHFLRMLSRRVTALAE
jgi:predicted MFS family arabinose efflux permease